jgi:transposase
MRATSLLRRILNIKGLVVLGQRSDHGDLVITVRLSKGWPRCRTCGRKTHSLEVATCKRRWRDLDFKGVKVFIEYDLRYADCKKCGKHVERVPWAGTARANLTCDFDSQVAFLAQRCDKTSIGALLRLSWRAVGRSIERAVKPLRPKDPLADLWTIGVDEISYRKHHNYLTLVTDHDSGTVVWMGKGKNSETLVRFFEELGDRRKDILFVSIDMSAAYAKAIQQEVPHATLTYDRFHVQKLVNQAVDQTRRAEWRRLKGTAEGKALKNSRYALLKNIPSKRDKATLARIQSDNRRLYRAYLMKEQFRTILDRKQVNVVRKMLHGWLSWASRSRLPAFVKVGRTLRKHLEGILAYVRWGFSNGRVEGINTKVRVTTRRAYGFHSAEATMAMIELCCSGLEIKLPHKALAE